MKAIAIIAVVVVSFWAFGFGSAFAFAMGLGLGALIGGIVTAAMIYRGRSGNWSFSIGPKHPPRRDRIDPAWMDAYARARQEGDRIAAWRQTVWGVLGVGPESTAAQINKAYRERAAAVHPDRGGDAAAMARLNVARDIALDLIREQQT